MALAWIRLLGLSGFSYKKKIVEAIGGLIGKVIKLDFQTDNQTRGHFFRLAVFINLEKPLVSQVMVDDAIQRVEYEALPTVYFSCGKYDHFKDLCPTAVTEPNKEQPTGVTNAKSDSGAGGEAQGKGSDYGSWVLVETRT